VNLENVGGSGLLIVVTIRLFAICWRGSEEKNEAHYQAFPTRFYTPIVTEAMNMFHRVQKFLKRM
jgi:hypothetical protein